MDLLNHIDQQSWMMDLKRRVQHYGYRYDYKARKINADAYLGDLPHWVMPIVHDFKTLPNQVIVNEYVSGQGIAAHIDCVPCFGETIVSLSLGSGVVMRFSRADQFYDLYLQPHSLLILSGQARYEWAHAIPVRQSDVIDGIKIMRGRRVSLTFRTVI